MSRKAIHKNISKEQRERCRLTSARFFQDNPDLVRKRSREYYNKHKEQYHRAYLVKAEFARLCAMLNAF